MVRNIIKKRNREGGFTFMELMIALTIFIIAVALVILATQGFFTKSRGTAMAGDIHTVQNAVDTYAIQSGGWPTANAALPATGNSTIDFKAIDKEGKSFYPDFISKLPRHWDEGVWLIDSTAKVSVDMAPDKY